MGYISSALCLAMGLIFSVTVTVDIKDNAVTKSIGKALKTTAEYISKQATEAFKPENEKTKESKEE